MKLGDGSTVCWASSWRPTTGRRCGPAPSTAQQFHIDVTVDDVDRAEAEVLALGATKHEVQPPEGEAWRVYLDPTGHPFCLCWD